MAPHALHLTQWTSPLGPILLGAYGEALCICAWMATPSAPVPSLLSTPAASHPAVVRTLRYLPAHTPVVVHEPLAQASGPSSQSGAVSNAEEPSGQSFVLPLGAAKHLLVRKGFSPCKCQSGVPVGISISTLLSAAIAQLAEYFTCRRTRFALPLLPLGTDFQRRVWLALQAVEYGATLSYGQLTRRLNLPPMAVRAVGQALGKNPLSLFLPCHRVIAANGALTGYAGTLPIKQRLLLHESPQQPLPIT